MKRTLVFSILVVMAGFFTYTCPMNEAVAQEPVIKIGINLELSGKQAPYGVPVARALRYEAERKNADGGLRALNGAKIEIVELDNATNAATATANAERLGSDPSILVTVGPCTSALSNAVEPTVGKWKMPNVCVMTTADKIFERGNEYIVSVTVMASKLGSSYAKFMVFMHEKFGIPLERITLAWPDDDYGKDLSSGFREELASRGFAKNIVADIPFDWQAKDLTPLVLRIKGAKPDFHLQVARTADGKLYHDACFTQRFFPYQVGGTSGFNHPTLWDLLGDKIAAATIGGPKLFFMELGAYDIPNPVRDAWVSKFHPQYPKIAVEQNLFFGATAANFLMSALEEAESPSREAINQALHGLRLKENDPRDFTGAYETPGLAFQSDGKARSWPTIAEWRKIQGDWQKVSIWHPTRGALNTPKEFGK